MTYKWASPHEWLYDQIMNGSIEGIDLADFVMHKVDADDIQDHFQSMMDEDGYFEDMDAPVEDALEEDEDNETSL